MFQIDDYAERKDTGIIGILLTGNINEYHLNDLSRKTERYIKRKIRSLVLSKEEYNNLLPELEKVSPGTLLAVATYFRNGVWQDDVSIWKDNAAKAPNKARVHENLGISYRKQGRIEEAIYEFKKAFEINPNLAPARNQLALIYSSKHY